MKANTNIKKLAVYLLVPVMLMSGCSSKPAFSPPSKELGQRLDRVVLRVFTDTGIRILREEEMLVGSAEGAEYAAEKSVRAAGSAGGNIALTGCHPQFGAAWIFTCPIGLVAGAAVAVGGSLVGIVGGGVYGATQALSEEEINLAATELKKTKELFDIKLAATFRSQLVSAVKTHTEVSLIDSDPAEVTMSESYDEDDLPVILAVSITGFKILQTGRLEPDLSLQIYVSAGFYSVPEAGTLYTRKWSYLTELGDFYDLTENDAAGLKQGINTALETVANAVVKDLLPVTGPETENNGNADWFTEIEDSEEVKPGVETVFSKVPVPRKGWYRDQKKKADCGDIDVQILLGRAYGAVDLRIFGWRGRDELIDGYFWLRVAQLSGRDDKEIVLYINEIKKNLEAEEITKAEDRAKEWRPTNCDS